MFFYRIFSYWPFVVWASVACLAVWGYLNTQNQHRYVGRVALDELIVAPLEDARVEAVFLEVGQRVSANDLLAQLDTSAIESEIDALVIDIKQEHRERERRYIEARHRLLEQRQKLVLAQKEDAARLKVLEEEYANLEKVYDRKLISQTLYFDTLEKVESLRSSIESYPGFLTEVEEELERLESSISVWDIGMGEALVDDDERIRFLNRRKGELTLRASDEAIVSEILVRPGEVVLSGDPILKLVLDGPSRVVGFIPESESQYPSLGDVMYVSSSSTGGKWLQAKVTGLAPNVVMVPDQVSPLPGKMVSGRYCYLELPEAIQLVGGETALIADKPPGFGSFLKHFKDVDTLSVSESKDPFPLKTEGAASTF
ncbi:hypothetical protein VDG1235_260 [Verrucomicrobiia bacterium DG1235]|nr:hypothetical protein VDG1235_260 [Verrucomicrobiae bacterium DG1235]